MKPYKKYRAVRVLVMILGVVAVIVVAAALFLTLNPVFGGRPTKEDKADYAKRAENYVNGKFIYPAEWEEEGLEETEYVSDKGKKPQEEIPAEQPSFDEADGTDDVKITWFGHSALLLQMHGLNILIDPMFGERSSPVSFAGPKRFGNPPAEISELPHIDVVVLSHDHYDHLDMDSIKQLDEKTDRFLVPLGVENHLERWGISSEKITNMAWWEETEIQGLTFACTPARHFSNRSINDNCKTLYCSWVFRDEYHQIFESGDTGYGGHFEEIHNRYGDFDFVMTDCAQFNKAWHYVHMYPEEAAMACETLGAKAVMPIHWGAFVLSSHPWDESAERFTAAAEAKGLTVVTPKLGQTFDPDEYQDYQERWWREVQ